MASQGAAPGLAPLHRRAFLVGAGAGAGWLLARGLGVPGLRGRPEPADPGETLRALAASLSPGQRELLVFPADHPARQIGNTLSVIERPHLGTILSPAQRALLEDLYVSMLSPRGREAFAGTVAVEGRLDGCVLAIWGEPETGQAQVEIMGGHLMLRGGGESAEDSAFGGPVAWGHQIGNQQWRVPGNSFAFHGDAANRLVAALSAAERERAIVPAPPHELVLQPQDAAGRFPGVRIGSLSEPGQAEAAALLDSVLSIWPEAAQARARACIDANGGPGALHVACYASHGFYSDMAAWGTLDAAERARRGDPYWQVWRIEGPGSVVHFQGYPHVHAYAHIVRDPARANVGESLAAVSAPVEGEAMRHVLEAALRRATGETLAFHGAAPGRFCPGEITTGLAWSLDPYRNRVVVASYAGRDMAPELAERLAAAGVSVEPDARYRVATAEYFASADAGLGIPERVERSDLLLRDALVAHLRAGGLSEGAA
jgi:hypothetical protein